jgi:DHA1 family tetracycline resistance protein-like MFS transporter
VVARLGERRTLFAGLLFGALGFFMFGGAAAGWLFLLAIPVNCLWGLAGPPSQSMMTQRVSPSEQGELQGAIGAVRSIAMLIGPGIFSVTFATFISPDRPVKVPGAPWYLAGLLLLIALAVARAVVPRSSTAAGARSVA